MNERKEFPAHYRKMDDSIQTVEEHLRDAGKKCEEYAGKLQFSHMGKLLGLLHDMGKYTDEFYNYIWEAIERERRGEEKVRGHVDHGRYGAMLVLERYHNTNSQRAILSEICAMILCYHHGGLEDFISDNWECRLLNRCQWEKEKDITEPHYLQAKERFSERVISLEELDQLYDKATEEFEDFVKKEKISGYKPYDLQLLIKFLYSCLIDADRYDTYLFMQKKKEEKESNISYLWENFSNKLKEKEESFRRQKTTTVLEKTIQELRYDIWKQCRDFSNKSEGTYTLTVPTGGGKTLSSLRFALDHARFRNKKRIIYVLPFTAIIEQNAEVVRKALGAGNNLLEHHSSVVTNKETNNDEIEYRQLLTERWTSPIIFTTMVQFLNTFFAGGTRDIRRLHSLTDTILIFDEIQALPLTCMSLFNEAINFLCNQCRDTILLCSATQPNLAGVKHKVQIKQELVKDITQKFRAFKRMEVIDKTEKRLSVSEAGDFIRELRKDNASLLVIMNTKSTAEEIYKEVKKSSDDPGVLFYFLSTNLCSAHRKKVIKEMKKALSDGRQVVCVSTQLIEAGVDISFSCVVRHLAGMDSVAQASGRGNRNGSGAIKQTYIITLEDEKLGSLEEIRRGEQCTKDVLNEYKRNKERFDSDLLSPKSISRYYAHYYDDDRIAKRMDFPVDHSISIYQMLSESNKRNDYKKNTNKKYPFSLDFQFGKAGKCFSVIDEYAESILVPYGEGKKIIIALYEQGKLPDYELIRSAQPYMVNISPAVLRKLEDLNAVHMEKKSGIWILEENYYDEQLGVVMEGKKKEALILGRWKKNNE